MNMHVGKFKVGDLVRRTTRDNAGSGPTLKVGTVAEVSFVDAGGWIVVSGYEKLRGTQQRWPKPRQQAESIRSPSTRRTS